MKRVEAIREGFYYTDGEKIITIAGSLPNRPEFFRAFTEDDEEIKIRQEKLYKVRLDENWLKDFGFKDGGSVFIDADVETTIKKFGPSYRLVEVSSSDKKRITILSVDELQNYLFEKTGKVPSV